MTIEDDEVVVVEVVLAASADAVWRALRDPAAIRNWHGWDYDELDAEIDQIFISGVTESEADGVLDMHGGGRFQVEPRGDHTVVRLTRSRTEGYEGWDGWWDAIDEGWTTFVQQLRFMLERHPADARRTIFLDGNSRAEDPGATVGIEAALEGLAPGERYEVHAGPGDGLSGELWFRSANQVGATVAGWGDGLIVVASKPAADGAPHGGAMAVLTTYGLDDSAFADLHARWSEWWRSSYADARVQT